jgi:hypothetical protein
MSSGSGINNKSGSLSGLVDTSAQQVPADPDADVAGIVGGKATTGAGAAVRSGNVVTPSGAVYNLANAKDVSSAKAELGASGFADLVQAAAAQGLTYNALTGTFASDAIEDVKVNKFVDDVSGKLSPEDEALIAELKKQGIAVNPATLGAARQALNSADNIEQFNAAIAAMRTANADGSKVNTQRAAELISQLSASSGINVMEVLFFVFRQSIQSTNEDKKYFLNKLQDYNVMAERLSDYLSDLVKESQNLSEASNGAKYPEKVTIPIQVSKFDLTTLDAKGEVAMAKGYPQTKTVDRAGLNDTIKDVESMQETVRNKRQMASTAFQNFDQKANQLYNLMASVLKVMNEMRSSTTRNML